MRIKTQIEYPFLMVKNSVEGELLASNCKKIVVSTRCFSRVTRWPMDVGCVKCYLLLGCKTGCVIGPIDQPHFDLEEKNHHLRAFYF